MIERFQRHLIERYLRANSLRYLVDCDGDFVVDFYGDDVPDYRVLLSVEGVDADILFIAISTDTAYPEAIRDRVEAFVADWNRDRRWPKASIVDGFRGRKTIRVIGDMSYPLGAGIHQALLDEFINVTMRAGSQMLRNLTSAISTPSSAELETWLGQTG
jgi:hypothetical protein